ncbi:MAG TPA: hypothetical protein VFE33_36065 [Thermoanaerobaculia bacterium]|nr:hypothetical protein [Thermoanaerobaculia bacterium]
MRAGLDADGKVRVVGADLVSDAIQRLREPAVELVDAGELAADDLPGDHTWSASRPTAVEKIGSGIPEERPVVKPPHEGERQDDGVIAQVFVKRRVEKDTVALDVRGQEGELRAGLRGEEPPGLDAVSRSEGSLERPHVKAGDAARGAEEQSQGEAQEAPEALLEAPVLDAGAGEAEGLEEVGQAGEGDEAGVVGEGRDPGEKSAVGSVGGGDTGLGGREIDGQVGVGAEVSLPDDGGQRTSLVGEAREDEGLGREEERLGVVGRVDNRRQGGVGG